jgi:hypothetical protein
MDKVLIVVGIGFVIFHYWAKWNINYDNSKAGFKEYNKKLKLKIDNNEKLTFLESFSTFMNKAFDIAINISLKAGLALIAFGIISTLIFKIKG